MGRILPLYCTDHPILLSTSQVMSPGLRLSLGWKRFSSSSPSHLLPPAFLRLFFLLFRFAASSYPSSAEYLIPGLPLSFMLYSAPHRRRTRRYDSAGGRGHSEPTKGSHHVRKSPSVWKKLKWPFFKPYFRHFEFLKNFGFG